MKFEVGKLYTVKTIFGYEIRYRCIKRTAKSVMLVDVDDPEEIVTKRIKAYSENDEYVEFSPEYMDYWCKLNA